jgi:hypothetical protein
MRAVELVQWMLRPGNPQHCLSTYRMLLACEHSQQHAQRKLFSGMRNETVRPRREKIPKSNETVDRRGAKALSLEMIA